MQPQRRHRPRSSVAVVAAQMPSRFDTRKNASSKETDGLGTIDR